MERIGTIDVCEAEKDRMAALGDGASKAKPGEYDAFVPSFGASTLACVRRAGDEFHVVVNVDASTAHNAGVLKLDASRAVLLDGTIQPT